MAPLRVGESIEQMVTGPSHLLLILFVSFVVIIATPNILILCACACKGGKCKKKAVVTSTKSEVGEKDEQTQVSATSTITGVTSAKSKGEETTTTKEIAKAKVPKAKKKEGVETNAYQNFENESSMREEGKSKKASSGAYLSLMPLSATKKNSGFSTAPSTSISYDASTAHEDIKRSRLIGAKGQKSKDK